MASCWRARAVMAMMGFAFACPGQGDGDARDLVRRAVEAHGGTTAIQRLEDLSMTCSGTHKGRMAFTRRLDARWPSRWAMEVRAGGAAMRFGVDRGRCRRQDRFLVRTCDPAEFEMTAKVLQAWFLYRLAEATARAAGEVSVDGRPHPAVRVGDLELVFDPESSLLKQIRYGGDHVETYSEEREILGVRFATRRVLTIGGVVDVDEVCEVVPGGADESRLALPEPSREGDVLAGVDPERLVAVTVLRAPRTDTLEALVRAAERALGPDASRSDGVVLAPPAEPGSEWEVAVTLEPGAQPPPVPGFHLETWPPRRYAGVLVTGDPLEAPSRWPRVSATLAERGLSVAPGSRLEVVTFPDTALVLLRVAVAPREGAERTTPAD